MSNRRGGDGMGWEGNGEQKRERRRSIIRRQSSIRRETRRGRKMSEETAVENRR